MTTDNNKYVQLNATLAVDDKNGICDDYSTVIRCFTKMFKFSDDINCDSNSNSIGNSINSRYSNGRDDNIHENVYLGSGGGCAAWREINSLANTVIGRNSGGAIMIKCKDLVI